MSIIRSGVIIHAPRTVEVVFPLVFDQRLTQDQRVQSLTSSLTSLILEPLHPMNEATKIYECPVCLSLPMCNIYQCTEGHLICRDCHNKMERPVSCPTCKSQMPATPIRSRVAEQVIYYILIFETFICMPTI